MTGGLSKVGRESMGDSQENGFGQVMANNYSDAPDQMVFYRNVSDRENNGSYMQAGYQDNYQPNQHKFSPKVALGQDGIYQSQASAGAVGGVQQHGYPSNNF